MGWKVFVLASTHNVSVGQDAIGNHGTPLVGDHRRIVDIVERRLRFALAMEAALYLKYLGPKPHRAAKIKELVDHDLKPGNVPDSLWAV